MKKIMFLCLCTISVIAKAARVVDGINYEFDRDKKVAYVIKADDSAPYSGDIVIPEIVKVGNNEFTVVAIQKSAFIDNDNITSLSLPESIVEIQEYAFRGCLKLTSLYLPDGLTKIGESAFANCRGLEELRLPDNGDIELGINAFSGAEKLRTLTIPDSWTSLGVQGKSAGYFQNSGFSELRIGKNIKYIGYGVFSGCSNLTTVICSEDCVLEEIGTRAFAGCSSLQNLKFLPRSLKIIGEKAFTGCSNLREVSIPYWVETITTGSWQDLYTGKLIIADSSTPFLLSEGSSGWSSLFDPINVYLGRPMIADKSSSGLFSTGELKRIDFGPYFEGGSEWKFGKNVRFIYSCVTDPTKLTFEFEDDVYDNATLYVPVGTMDAYMAQENFSKFFDVQEFYPEGYLGNSSWYIDFADIIAKNICLNNWDTDYDCELTPKEIEAITDIGDAFKESYMTTFDEFKHFTGLKTIPKKAFSGSKYLESIELPYTIESIDEYAFSSCTKLKSISIGYNVTTIGEYAFNNCRKLESVEIPPVKSIGYYAFADCDALAHVTCWAKNVPQTDTKAFGWSASDLSNVTLSVRKESIDAYKAAEPWKYFKNISAALLKGDVNCDYDFNIDDIKCVANYVIGESPEDFEFDAADIDGDGNVNVKDIVEIIKIVQKYESLRNK